MKLKISSNGQVSIPAEVRRRWGVTEVLVNDQGDRLIVLPARGPAALRGILKDKLPPTEQMRAEARAEERQAEERRQ